MIEQAVKTARMLRDLAREILDTDQSPISGTVKNHGHFVRRVGSCVRGKG